MSCSIRNTVLALEPGRLIRWSTRPLTVPLSLLIGGQTWTFELDEEPGGTRATETWNLRPERNRRVVRRLAGDPATDMRRTLDQLARQLPAAARATDEASRVVGSSILQTYRVC